MASIFDQTRNLLKGLQAKAVPLAQSYVNNYVNTGGFNPAVMTANAAKPIVNNIVRTAQPVIRNVGQQIGNQQVPFNPFPQAMPLRVNQIVPKQSALGAFVTGQPQKIAANFNNTLNQATKNTFGYQVKNNKIVSTGIGPEQINNVLLGGIGAPESNFTKQQLDLVRNGFGKEVRNLVGQFTTLAEKNPQGINRKALGPLGEYVHSLAETVFGPKAANLTNKQLANAFDAIQEAASKGKPTSRLNIGLGVKNIRGQKVANAGLTPQDSKILDLQNQFAKIWKDPVMTNGEITDKIAPIKAQLQKLKAKSFFPPDYKPNVPQAGLYDTAYHAGSTPRTEFTGSEGVMGQGVYLHENPNVAKTAAAMERDGNLADVVNHKVQLLTDKIYKAGHGYPTPEEIASIKKQGFDGIKTADGEYVIFDPKKVKVLSNDRVARQPVAKAGIGEVSGKLPQSAELTTNKIDTLEQKIPEQTAVGVGQGNVPNSPSSGGIIPPQDPVQQVIGALKGAKPLRGQQEALYSKARAQQVARVAAMGQKVSGEKGYFAQLGQLKGELPKVQFESIRKQLTQPSIDALFNKVEQSPLSPFEKVTAKGGLAKLLGAEGGNVPTRSELNLLNEIFPPEFMQAVMEKRPFMQKLWGATEQALNLPRAIMATADLSAPLRQGIFLIGRPKQFVPAFRDMFKYAFSEQAYRGLNEQIRARPTYQAMRQSKLALTDMGAVMGSREEAFMSNLAEKIPGFGQLAKGSNRAYSGFLNKLRADTFDDLYKNAQQLGITKDRPQVTDDIANFVNAATGRGKLPGAVEKAAVALNATFFSPRLMASRINLLNPIYYAKLDPFVRKEALKSLFTFAGTAVSVLSLAKLAGADVSADPRSADFAKIKVGNTRYDILGGFQQYLRLAGQLITGQKINTQTGKLTTLGDGFGAPTRKDILASFFESKTAPVASFIISMLQGKDASGNKFNLSTEVLNRFIPMITQDMYDISKENGSPLGVIPGIFGVGVQTYGKTEAVTGKNQLGEPTSQIRPVQGLGEAITEKLFGMQPLGNSGSTNIQTYYDQLLKMPREQAAAKFEEIRKTNPDLAKKIVQESKDRALGITVQDRTTKALGVASGDRAMAVADEFNKLKTREEKAALWEHYVKIGIITKDVAKQLIPLIQK